MAGFYIIYYFPLLLSITLFQVNGAPLHLQIGTCTTKVCTGNKTMKYIHNKSHNDDGQCWWWLKFSYGFNRCPSKSLRAIGGFELCWLKIYCRPTGVNHWDNYELILFTLCSCTVCHCSLPDILLGVGCFSWIWKTSRRDDFNPVQANPVHFKREITSFCGKPTGCRPVVLSSSDHMYQNEWRWWLHYVFSTW